MSHRILVVEDDEAVLDSLSEILRRYGYDVETAGSLEEARDLLREHFYSLVFTDLRLGAAGELEGLALVREVRRISPVTRTVVLTGGADANLQRRVLSSRADALLFKPVEMREIGAVAAQCLGTAPLIA